MKELPTAEEFLYENDMRKLTTTAMIEFAKLHVEAALKAASEDAEGVDEDGYYVPNSSIDKQSILQAYPLTNIK